MYKTNDYLKLTQQYLRNYTYYMTAIENLNDELTTTNNMLAEVSVKSIDYGEVSGGSGINHEKLNGVECIAATHIELQERAEKLKQQLSDFRLQVRRISRALEVLSRDEYQAVTTAYIAGRGIKALEEVLYRSERQNRRILRSAEKHVAIMLFGGKADNDVLFVKPA